MDIKGRLAVGALKMIGKLPLHWSRRLGWFAGKIIQLVYGDTDMQGGNVGAHGAGILQHIIQTGAQRFHIVCRWGSCLVLA